MEVGSQKSGDSIKTFNFISVYPIKILLYRLSFSKVSLHRLLKFSQLLPFFVTQFSFVE